MELSIHFTSWCYPSDEWINWIASLFVGKLIWEGGKMDGVRIQFCVLCPSGHNRGRIQQTAVMRCQLEPWKKGCWYWIWHETVLKFDSLLLQNVQCVFSKAHVARETNLAHTQKERSASIDSYFANALTFSALALQQRPRATRDTTPHERNSVGNALKSRGFGRCEEPLVWLKMFEHAVAKAY